MTLHATFDQVLRTAAALRVDLPAEIVSDYQRLDEIYTDVGRDLSGAEARLGLQAEAAQLLSENAEELFALFTDCFDVAAGILRDNASSLRGLRRLAAEPDTPEYRRIRYADAVMEKLLSLWAHMSIAGTGFPTTGRRTLLVIADVTPKTWSDLRLQGANVRPWQAAGLPLHFSLATPASFTERYNAVSLHLADVAAGHPAEAKAARDEWRHRSRVKVDPLAFVP